MPHYKLTYFNFRGRAEISRLMFAAARIDFTDERLTFDEWKVMKPSTKLGVLPILTVGDHVIVHSMAIARHLARAFGLYGHTNEEATTCDMVLESAHEVYDAFVAALNSPEDQKKEKMDKAKGVLEKMLEFFENLYKNNRKGKGFIVGDKISVGDFAIYELAEKASDLPTEKKKKLPNVFEANKAAVESVRSVKEYLDKRPKSDI